MIAEEELIYTLTNIFAKVIFSFFAASFPRVAERTFTPCRLDCHQDTNHNCNRSPCWINSTRKCKNRIASISRRRIWIRGFFSGKQVSLENIFVQSSLTRNPVFSFLTS